MLVILQFPAFDLPTMYRLCNLIAEEKGKVLMQVEIQSKREREVVALTDGSLIILCHGQLDAFRVRADALRAGKIAEAGKIHHQWVCKISPIDPRCEQAL